MGAPVSQNMMARVQAISNVNSLNGQQVNPQAYLQEGGDPRNLMTRGILTHDGRWVDFAALSVQQFPQPVYSTVQVADGQTSTLTFFTTQPLAALNTPFYQSHLVNSSRFAAPDSFLITQVQIHVLYQPVTDTAAERAAVTLTNRGGQFGNINEFYRKALLKLQINGNNLVFQFPAQFAAGGVGWTGWGATGSDVTISGTQMGVADFNNGGACLFIPVYIASNTNFSFTIEFDAPIIFGVATDLLRVRCCWIGIESKSYA